MLIIDSKDCENMTKSTKRNLRRAVYCCMQKQAFHQAFYQAHFTEVLKAVYKQQLTTGKFDK